MQIRLSNVAYYADELTEDRDFYEEMKNCLPTVNIADNIFPIIKRDSWYNGIRFYVFNLARTVTRLKDNGGFSVEVDMNNDITPVTMNLKFIIEQRVDYEEKHKVNGGVIMEETGKNPNLQID